MSDQALFPESSRRRSHAAAVVLLIAGACGAGAGAAAELEANYEIVRATENRVWRLNKQTGEVAVCTLEGPQLVCVSSESAAVPPAKSYAELEAERAQQSEADAREREEERRRKMAMLNLMMEAFKGLAEQGEAAGAEGGAAGASGASTATDAGNN